MQVPTNPGRDTNSPLLRVELEHEENDSQSDWLARNSLLALAAAVVLLVLLAVLIAVLG